MAGWRSAAIGFLLAAGFLLVSAGPAWLVWNAIQPEPWSTQTLKVKFESVRMEAGGLVFRYTVENRTRRLLRLLPGQTSIRVLQKPGLPPAGYPSVSLPLDIDARRASHIEVRLEIPTPSENPSTSRGLGQDWVEALPEDTDDQAAVSHLPRMAKPAGATGPARVPESFVRPDPLESINGFELTDQNSGARIVLPGVW